MWEVDKVALWQVFSKYFGFPKEKHLSDKFPIQNCLEQGFIVTALEYALKKVQEHIVELKLNGTHLY
jgi:hypothetical protein